jgi:putative addiction module component (TIGR02574 family)
MRYNTKELLALPDKEKRGLAKKLWKSLADSTGIVKENEATITELDKRWNSIENGDMKTYSSKDFWE